MFVKSTRNYDYVMWYNISHRKVFTSRYTQLGCLGPVQSAGRSGSGGSRCASRVSRSRSFFKKIKNVRKNRL